MDRDVDGFWWTWRQGQDWPSWYYGEKVAREGAKRLAMSNPGLPVYIGKTEVVERMMLPDNLVVERHSR